MIARMMKEYKKSKEEDLHYQVDRLEEMMKCVTLMTDMEDASTMWRKWGSSVVCVDSERAIEMEVDEPNGMDLGMMEVVEDECVEHAFLDFLHMELGMDEVRVEPGEGFRGDEEWAAHAELDEILGLSGGRCQDDMGTEVRIDKCNREAYYGGGTWWLDRWLQGRPEIIATSARKLSHGEKNTLASELLAIQIVQPREKKSMSPIVLTPNDDINVDCSGPAKRPWSGRTGRWWPGSGQSRTTRAPWRSTSRAATRLRALRSRVLDNDDKFLKENLPWAKPVEIAGAGGSTNTGTEESVVVDKSNIIHSHITTNTACAQLRPGSSGDAVKDNSGKEFELHLTNQLLTGQNHAGSGYQGEEGVQRGVHGHHEGGDQLFTEGVHGQRIGEASLDQGQLKQGRDMKNKGLGLETKNINMRAQLFQLNPL